MHHNLFILLIIIDTLQKSLKKSTCSKTKSKCNTMLLKKEDEFQFNKDAEMSNCRCTAKFV